jgi:hypothetical protein
MGFEIGSDITIFSKRWTSSRRRSKVSISISASSSEAETDLLTYLIEIMEEVAFHIIDESPDG